MAEFVTVAKVGDIPEGEGRSFSVDGKLVGLFYVDGKYSAINDICPHMGASLSGGNVEEGAVYCPWHAWRFCVTTGAWLDNPKSDIKTECYQVRIQNDEIQVSFSDDSPEN